MDKIKWGIVGPGIIAHEFAHDFHYSEYAELVAVASRDAERAGRFTKKFNIPRWYDDYHLLYNDQEIDAIYVATPHVFHRKNSEDALAVGKAILCEKPLTDNLDDTISLVNAAKTHNTYLMEGMWTYFLPAVKTAYKWVSEGKIGKVEHVKAGFGYPSKYDPATRYYNPDLAGGCLLDMGCYTIAMAWLFLKQDPLNINVIARKAPNGVDIDVNMQFEYIGATASLASSFKVKLHNWAFIIGEKGYIAIPDFWRAKNCYLYEGETIADEFIDSRKGFGFNYEIDEMSRDLIKGENESAVMPHHYSLKIAEHIDRVMKQFN